MAYSINILESNRTIESMVINEIIDHLNKKAPKAIPRIQQQLSTLIQKELKKTLVYKEALTGTLKAELGFVQGREKTIMDGIIDIIANEVQVDFTPFVNSKGVAISGGYTIYMIDSSFQNALSSSLAVTMNKGEELPWLEWLLKEGDKIIIAGYKILFKNTKYGRSKEALMVKGGLDPNQVVRHTLRHTAITHLVQAGVDLPTVKRISGHKTLAMVERYAHQNGEHIQGAMDRLQARLKIAS